LLYVPFEESENRLKHNLPRWQAAYSFHESTIQTNEAKFTYNINSTWGGLKNEIEQPDNIVVDIDDTMRKEDMTRFQSKENDLETYFPCRQESNMKKSINLCFQVKNHPFFLENEEYCKIRRMLNREQQEIVKDIAFKKQSDMHTPLYLFLTSGVGTWKFFTTKVLFQMLIRIYDAYNTNDPMKLRGLILAYTCKVAYNVDGTTIHSTLLMPFNKSHFLPLSK
jgi:hypothetical protein